MVNFSDPTVIAQDLCVSSFVAEHARSRSLLIPTFNSGSYEVLARYGWSLHVSLSGSATLPSHDLFQ
jgi:hypothetical protein